MASATTTALPPAAFKGDGEGMVDLLVDACVRSKEATRVAVAATGAPPPRAGRDLVPYFNPGSSDWGINDVNGNTEDSDSADGSSRGYDSSGSSSSSPQTARRKGIKVAAQSDHKKQGSNISKKNKHKREKMTPGSSSRQAQCEAASPKAANVPAPGVLLSSVGQPEGRSAYAGTRFGLASPLPETLPMPTSFLLGPAISNAATANTATNALRSFLQIDAADTNKGCFVKPMPSTAAVLA